MSASSRSEWDCAVCTYRNSGARTICEACGTPRQKINAVPAHNTSPSQVAPIPPPPPPPPAPSAPPAATRATAPQVFTLPSPVLPKSGVSEANSPPRWTCSVCGARNALTALRCVQCNGARQSPSAAAADIAYLVNMGFTRATAVETLIKFKDRDAALDYLLAHPPQYAAVTPPNPPPPHPPIQIISHSRNTTPQATSGNLTSSRTRSSSSTSTAPSPSSSVSTATSAPAVQRNRTSSQPHSIPTAAADIDRERADTESKRLAAERDAAAKLSRAAQRKALLDQVNTTDTALDKAVRLTAVDEARHHRDVEQRQRLLKSIEKDKLIEQEKAREATDRALKRQSAEHLTIDEAISAMKSSYDIERFVAFCLVLSKIIRNIIGAQHDKTSSEKVRTLKTANETIQRCILRPIGGAALMKQLGFRQTTRPRARTDDKMEDVAGADEQLLYLSLQDVDVNKLQSALDRLQRELDAVQTSIPRHMSVLQAETQSAAPSLGSDGDELLYYLLLELRTIFVNVISAPTERNFCSVDTQSPTFSLLFATVPSTEPLLNEFGFKRTSNGVYLVCDDADVRLLEAAVIDINKQIGLFSAKSPVYLALNNVIASNTADSAALLYAALVSAVNNVIGDVFESKFHRIRLDKLYAKCKLQSGESADRLVASVGFIPQPRADEEMIGEFNTARYAALTAPVNGELLRLRLLELSRRWRDHIRPS